MLETFVRRTLVTAANVKTTAESVALRAALLGSEATDFSQMLEDMKPRQQVVIPRTSITEDAESDFWPWSDKDSRTALRAALRYILEQHNHKGDFTVNTVAFDAEGNEIPAKVAKDLADAQFQVGITRK